MSLTLLLMRAAAPSGLWAHAGHGCAPARYSLAREIQHGSQIRSHGNAHRTVGVRVHGGSSDATPGALFGCARRRGGAGTANRARMEPRRGPGRADWQLHLASG